MHEDWLAEQSYIKNKQLESPDEFVLANPPDYYDLLAGVGITSTSGQTEGIIKQLPTDFIVEEIQRDFSITEVTPGSPGSVNGQAGPFVRLDLVKMGISTIDAIRDLSRRLKIPETKFEYGGIKDAKAVTAQQISIANPPLDILTNYPTSNYLIKNLRYADKALGVGQISGNRFTILVRTEHTVDIANFSAEIEDLNKKGFWNYYWTQRFGSRYLSHYWGMLLLRGDVQALVKSYLVDPGPNDVPFFIQLRTEAEEKYGDWKAMYQIYKPLAFSFRYELDILKHLMEYNSDFVGAVRNIPDQVKFWSYAYASFMANRLISSYASGQSQPLKSIPLLFTDKKSELSMYESYLKIDNVPITFREKLRRFDFIRFSSRYLETRLPVKINGYKTIPEGLVISFDLDKGAYATTFLSNIFALKNHVTWVKDKKIEFIDLKAVLNLGEISTTVQDLSAAGQTSTEDTFSE